MNRTDFIDDDLIRRRDSVRQVKFGPGENDAADDADVARGAVPMQEINLTPLARRREEIKDQMVNRMDELERLRARQESLERERNALEQLRQNQEKYESGKRDLIERLEQHLVFLEREEIRLNQHLSLIVETTGNFKDMLKMARGLDETQWPEDSNGFREELHRALVMVEDARKEFNKAVARIEALRDEKSPPMSTAPLAAAGSIKPPRSFTDWMMIGLAASLPLIVTMLVLAAVMLFRPGY